MTESLTAVGQIDLFSGTVALPYVRGSVPSAEAADKAVSKAERDRRAILAFLASNGPATDDEILKWTGVHPNAVRARRGELQDALLVTKLDEAGVSASGNRASRWVLTGRAK